MNRVWKAIPLAVALAFAGFVWWQGPALMGRAAYEVMAGENRAEREALRALSDRDTLSPLFRRVNKVVSPAVVVIHVKQKVQVGSGSDPEEFFRRFFGDNPPFRTPQPRQPSPDRSPRREYYSRGIGSGVIVDAEKGYVLTNWHVVNNADEVEVVTHDNRHFEAEWVHTDKATDLAVIKIDPDRLHDAPLGDSDKMGVGDWVLAFGAPEGLSQTVTAGIISAKGRTTSRGNAYQDFIQTDAAINHGNSGGPLVNMLGEVIGINAAIISRTGVNEGIGLAVPSNMVKKIMAQLIEKGKVTRGYLGVVIQNVDENLAESFKLPHAEGALVSQVAEGTPADKAGIQVGDFITAVNGKEIANVNELRNAVAHLDPDKTIPLTVFRDGKRITVKVKLSEQPADMAAAFGGETPPAPDEDKAASAARYGVKVAGLDEEKRRQLGYKDGVKGVLITDIDPGSDAADQGIRAGMVIVQVQGKAIKNVSDFEKAMGSKEAATGARLLLTDPSGGRRFVFITPEKAPEEKPEKKQK